jgi:hypothetical protein
MTTPIAPTGGEIERAGVKECLTTGVGKDGLRTGWEFKIGDAAFTVDNPGLAIAIATAHHSALRAEKAKSEGLEAERDSDREVIEWANNSLYGSLGYFVSLNGGERDKLHLARGIEDLKTANRKGYAEAAGELSDKLRGQVSRATEAEAALSSALARIAELEGALEKIDGEAPAMNEPPKCWTCSDPCEAFHEGYVRGLWDAAVIARAALQPTEEIAK